MRFDPRTRRFSVLSAYWAALRAYIRREGYYPLSYALLPLVFMSLIPERSWLHIVLLGVPSLGLYLPSYWLPARGLRRSIVAQCALALTASLLSPVGILLYLYPMMSSTRLVTRQSFLRTFAAIFGLMMLNALGLALVMGELRALVFAPVAALLITLTYRFEVVRERATARQRLAEADARRVGASAERERIAADLHDLLGQSLTLITVKAGLMQKLAAQDPDAALRESSEIGQIARRALVEVRQAVSTYHAPTFEDELARAHLALRSVGVPLEVTREPITLTTAAETALAFTLRESVTNIVRHAEASQVQLELRAESGELNLTIRDNGKGIQGSVTGNGTEGMRTRLHALGGVVELRRLSAQGGTEVRARIPQASRRLSPADSTVVGSAVGPMIGEGS